MNTERIDIESAKEFLQSHGIQGTDEEFDVWISYDFFTHPVILECFATVLNNLVEGQINRIREPDVSEAIIHAILQAGYPEFALNLYHGYFRDFGGYFFGGCIEVGLKKGNFRRGLRITSAFQTVDLSTMAGSQKDSPEMGFLPIKHDHALYLTELGEIKQAETILRELAFSTAFCFTPIHFPGGEASSPVFKTIYQYIARQNLGDVLVMAGKLREAVHIADGMIQAYESDDVVDGRRKTQSEELLFRLGRGDIYYPAKGLSTGSNPYARRAVALTLQGKIREALTDFKRAKNFQHKKFAESINLTGMLELYEEIGKPLPDRLEREKTPWPLIGQAAIYYAMLLIRLGKLNTARKILDYSRKWAALPEMNLSGVIVYAELALSDIYRLKGEFETARRYLDFPLQWATETGQRETYCWAHLSMARLELAQNRLPEAQQALDEALNVAGKHNFKLYEIDCIVTAGRIALLQQDLTTAENRAKTALELVSDPDFAYAWARGNTLHLMGEVLYRKTDFEKARRLEKARWFLTGAAKLRKRIKDPRLLNTEALLAQMPNTNKGE